MILSPSDKSIFLPLSIASWKLNVINSLSEIAPYIEADGGFVEFVEIEEDTNYVKVRLGGACTSCAMSAMTLKQGIENKIMQDIPDCNGVIQVL